MYEFWNEHIKPKYVDNVKLCYIDTDSFEMHIKTEDLYKDIADDVGKRTDTSNYEWNTVQCNSIECNRPLPKGKNKKVIGLTNDELGGMTMTEFVAPGHKILFLSNR